MADYSLSMTFITEDEEKATMTVSGVDPAVNATKVNALMDEIISGQVIEHKKGNMASKYEAKLTEKKVTTFSVE